MLGPNWILAYEADQKFDYKLKTRNTQGNPLFKILYEDNASFYNTEAVLPVFREEKDIQKLKSAIEPSAGGYEELFGDPDDDEGEADDLDI